MVWSVQQGLASGAVNFPPRICAGCGATGGIARDGWDERGETITRVELLLGQQLRCLRYRILTPIRFSFVLRKAFDGEMSYCADGVVSALQERIFV